MRLDDKYSRYAKPGIIVIGQVVGDGDWLRLGKALYLPMRINSLAILEPVSPRNIKPGELDEETAQELKIADSISNLGGLGASKLVGGNDSEGLGADGVLDVGAALSLQGGVDVGDLCPRGVNGAHGAHGAGNAQPHVPASGADSRSDPHASTQGHRESRGDAGASSTSGEHSHLHADAWSGGSVGAAESAACSEDRFDMHGLGGPVRSSANQSSSASRLHSDTAAVLQLPRMISEPIDPFGDDLEGSGLKGRSASGSSSWRRPR